MADIIFIAPVEDFSQREVPPFTKLNAQVTSKINTIRDNANLINTGLETLLQGVSGGVEQAKIPLVMASAPTGWTRDTNFSTDRMLRITDGITVPPGANPSNTGGVEGGSWTIIGSSAALSLSHTHSLQNHTHTMGSHTHSHPPHAHSDLHSHTVGNHTHEAATAPAINSIGASAFISILGSPPNFSVGQHTHSIAAHNHGTWSSTGAGTTSVSNASDTDNSSTGTSPAAVGSTGDTSASTSSDGSHPHTVNHNNTWRPKYLNVLMCKKD